MISVADEQGYLLAEEKLEDSRARSKYSARKLVVFGISVVFLVGTIFAIAGYCYSSELATSPLFVSVLDQVRTSPYVDSSTQYYSKMHEPFRKTQRISSSSTRRSYRPPSIRRYNMALSAGGEEEEKTKIFIGNVGFDATAEYIADTIKTASTLKVEPSAVQIVTNKKGRPRGFVFVELNSFENAEVVSESIHDFFDGQRYWYSNVVFKGPKPLSPANQKRPYDIPRSLFFSNLHYSLTDEELLQMFDDLVGANIVTGIKVPLDKTTKKPKGYAHIEFIDKESRDRAIQEIDGLEVFDRNIRASPLQKPGLTPPPTPAAVMKEDDEEEEEKENSAPFSYPGDEDALEFSEELQEWKGIDVEDAYFYEDKTAKQSFSEP